MPDLPLDPPDWLDREDAVLAPFAMHARASKGRKHPEPTHLYRPIFHGGFDHNLHALRVVELLEERYQAFPGLNLSWEVREAFAQHAKRRDDPGAREFLAAGQPLLEAQVVDATDSLTYDTHDIDDALG